MQLLEDDAAFRLQVPFRHGRLGEHIAENVKSGADMPVERARIKAGVFLGRICIQHAADFIHLLRNRQRRAAGGSFEQHMLNKMGDTCGLRRFITRTASDPDAHGGAARPVHRLQQDPEAVC